MMSNTNDERCKNLLIALRKMIQAIDRHSTNLKKKFGLTGPQLILLQSISAHNKISVTQLSKNVSLSQATVTDITKRLENRNFITRTRDIDDKRKTNSAYGKWKSNTQYSSSAFPEKVHRAVFQIRELGAVND